MGRYKPIIRVFKNARNYLIENNALEESAAPSYFLECLLYNAPDNAYRGSLRDVYLNIIASLLDADFNDLLCQNEQTYLFGSSPDQWSLQDAVKFLSAMIDLWRNW